MLPLYGTTNIASAATATAAATAARFLPDTYRITLIITITAAIAGECIHDAIASGIITRDQLFITSQLCMPSHDA